MMNARYRVRSVSILATLTAVLFSGWGPAAERGEKAAALPNENAVNKLQYMYAMYYLPFSIDFRVGKTANDILPYVQDRESSHLIKAEELKKLDAEWSNIKSGYADKALLMKTPVPVGQTVRITDHLVSHHISITQTALGNLSLDERIQISKALAGHSPEVQASFKQLAFLKSLMKSQDYDKLNLFIFSANWCESCKEYRILLENYFKTFQPLPVVLHSVMIEDPKEEVFDKPLLHELFPHPKKYSHESIPMFLAIEFPDGRPVLYEEGEALQVMYERFLKAHRGYLDQKVTLFKKGKGVVGEASHVSDSLYSSLK